MASRFWHALTPEPQVWTTLAGAESPIAVRHCVRSVSAGLNTPPWARFSLNGRQIELSAREFELLIARDEVYRTYSIDYHQGGRYPHLERTAGTPDTLSDIFRPHAKPVATANN